MPKKRSFEKVGVSSIPVGVLSTDRVGGSRDRISSNGAKSMDGCTLQLYPKVMAAVY
jgi:hypothetical protein